MIEALRPDRYAALRPLFAPMDQHLAALAVLENRAPGSVFVDQPDEPEAAMVVTGRRFYLAGSPGISRFNQQLRKHFITHIYPQALEAGQSAFTLYYPDTHWEPAIAFMLQGKYPIQDGRLYYEMRDPAPDWRGRVPPGFEIRQLDASLLQESGLGNYDHLLEEMQSESPSIEHFLKHCFGFCVVGEGAIAAWCLSEYNLNGRCEVGIETMQPYRRRGFATLTACALIEHARSRGIERIGWHCWSSNTASRATAERVGFSRVMEYPAFFAWFNAAINLAVNGNMRFAQADYQGAAEWYERALQAGGDQAWIFWNAACANARLGAHQVALQRLQEAFKHGFDDRERLQASEHLENLRALPGWKTLLEQLDN
jgi:RimJ/RimL family protein N-acetyltransferase